MCPTHGSHGSDLQIWCLLTQLNSNLKSLFSKRCVKVLHRKSKIKQVYAISFLRSNIFNSFNPIRRLCKSIKLKECIFPSFNPSFYLALFLFIYIFLYYLLFLYHYLLLFIYYLLILFLYIYAAAAAAKSLQSCLTLCDPRDSSPPGSSIPGILQARALEWVAISFSNAWKWKVKAKSLSRVRLFVTPWTAAYQASPSMGFSRQEYWSGVPLPSPWEAHRGWQIRAKA